MDKSIDECFDIIHNPNYKFNDNYGIAYLSHESFNLLSDALSVLRRSKSITPDEFHSINDIHKLYYRNLYRIRDLNYMQPRLIAQKFIGKKKIRDFIFKRDGNKCLRCGRNDKLTLDHIVPISKSGENKISNLQTLCRSCNSIKRDSFKDYRYGAR